MWLGTFPDGYDPATHDPLSWHQNWLPFDQTIIGGTSGLLPAGRFSRTASGSGTGVSGKKIYWLLFQTPSGSVPASDLTNVTALGLFSSTELGWIFPQDNFSNYTLVTSASANQAYGGGTIMATSLRLAAFETLTPYQAWIAGYALTGDQTGPLTNPLHDGIPNLLRFAFNLDPTHANPSNLISGTGVSGLPLVRLNAQGQLVIEFVRRRAGTNPGIRYLVETGGDLSALTALSLSGATVSSIDTTWERVMVTDPIISNRRFGHIRIMEN